jgi:dTDP-4-amino-4,6-dideoxy-D-galactose acyltransferase
MDADDVAQDVIEAARETDCRLLYLPSDRRLADETVASFGGALVDVKTTFAKKFTGEPMRVGRPVEPYHTDDSPQRMRDLAVQSAEYSRFNVDKKLPRAAFEKLYETWILRSVAKEIAKEVLVIREHGVPVGLITLGEKNGRADIGILAVDESARGKGYGAALVDAAENWFVQHGYTRGQVVTQGTNAPACGLYRKCGYAVESEAFFYHFWL